MEEALFRLINQASANPLFDALMPVITRGRTVTLIIVVTGLSLLAGALRRDRATRLSAVTLVLSLGAAITLCEWIGSQGLKEWIARPRPPLHYAEVRLLVGLGHSYSFPSAHAANTAAFAYLIGRHQPRLAVAAMAFAALIAYSRVYVGVHHVSDVLAGALLGMAVAALTARVAERLAARIGLARKAAAAL